MKILNLIIKQKYFDEIIAGTKKEEYREVKPSTIKKYIKLDENSTEIVENDEIVCIKYDAIRFFVGYNKDRDSALVEVKNAEVNFFYDDADPEQKPEKVQIGEDENGEPIWWYFQEVTYFLGEILEKDIHPKK